MVVTEVKENDETDDDVPQCWRTTTEVQTNVNYTLSTSSVR